jgi:hypothetical protein
MLCTISTRLQVGMYASSLNFYRLKEIKFEENLKWHNEVRQKVQMELQSKWNSCVECKQEKES